MPRVSKSKYFNRKHKRGFWRRHYKQVLGAVALFGVVADIATDRRADNSEAGIAAALTDALDANKTAPIGEIKFKSGGTDYWAGCSGMDIANVSTTDRPHTPVLLEGVPDVRCNDQILNLMTWTDILHVQPNEMRPIAPETPVASSRPGNFASVTEPR